MENLKITLFEKTAAALETYKRNKAAEPGVNWELDRRSFCTLYQLIEDAGLADEYNEWRYGRE